MASETEAWTPNLSAIYGTDKTDWPVLGGRVHPDLMDFVDEAAERVGLKRAHFAVAAALDRAERVLGRKFEIGQGG